MLLRAVLLLFWLSLTLPAQADEGVLQAVDHAAACDGMARLEAEQAELLVELSRTNRRRVFSKPAGPIFGVLVSGILTGVLINMTKVPRPRAEVTVLSIGAGISAAGLAGSAVAAGFRLPRSLRESAHFLELEEQFAQRTNELRQLELDGCLGTLTPTARRIAIDVRLHEVIEKGKAIDTGTPALLMIVTGVATVGLATVAMGKWLLDDLDQGVAEENDEEIPPRDPLPARLLAGGAVVAGAALAASAVWFRKRRAQRASFNPEIRWLRERKNVLRTAFVPQFNAQGFGLGIHGSF